MNLDIGTSNVIQFPSTKTDGLVLRPNIHAQSATMGPMEREMRTKLAKLKGCKYSDTFDWSVYDRIASRFEEQPPGGVLDNSTLKLLSWHPSRRNYHDAFEVDTYGRGCIHDCVYRYTRNQLTTNGYWNRPIPFPINLSEIRRIFYTVFETSRSTEWRDILEKKTPLRIGSMSDAFMWLDVRYGVTKEFLRILNFYNYPHIIFTRSDLPAHDDYLSILRKDLCEIHMAIIGNNHTLIKKIEPGSPGCKRRLKALRRLVEAGICSKVRIDPLLPRHVDGYYSNPDRVRKEFGSLSSSPTLNLYDENFIEEIAATGAKNVSADFARLSRQGTKAMSRALGQDISKFFLPEVTRLSNDNYFTNEEISVYYQTFARMCAKNKLHFSTCNIGDAEMQYFAYRNLWTNKADCCPLCQ